MARPRRIPDGILNDAPYLLAGDVVRAGVYWEIDGRREVWLTHTGVLPASLDGRVATYIRRPDSLEMVRRNSSPFDESGDLLEEALLPL